MWPRNDGELRWNHNLLEKIKLRAQCVEKHEIRTSARLDVAKIFMPRISTYLMGMSGAQVNFSGGFGTGRGASTR
jgi:hypothetical protein